MIGKDQTPDIGKDTQFKEGISGNPNGAPKGVPHSRTRLKRLLELTEQLTNPITHEQEGFTVAEQLDLAQILRARKGDTRAYIALLDRLEGRPDQSMSLEHTGDLFSATKLNINIVDGTEPKTEQ